MSLYSRLLAIRAGHRRSGPSLLFLTILPVLLFSTGCTPTQIIAASDWRNRPEIMLGVFTTGPALSPDGKSVVLPVMVRGVPGTKLVVLNVGNGELRTFDSPPDEVWEGPSFSPTGNRIAFLRHCMDKCTGRKGHHVSILDQKTGEVTIVTKETRIVRVHPVFSPDGRFVAYGSLKRIYEGNFARLEWSYWWGVFTDRIRILDLVTGVEHEIPSEKYGIEWYGPVFPKGWLNENTLLISARRPKRSSRVIGKFKQRVKNMNSHYRNPESDYYFPYTLSFDRPFTAKSGVPRHIALDLLETDWNKPGVGIEVSSDTGTMVLGQGTDIFLGNAKAIRRAASLPKSVSNISISKSGNRVALLVRTDRLRRQLWMLDVTTGKVWQTGLEQRLLKLYPPSRAKK